MRDGMQAKPGREGGHFQVWLVRLAGPGVGVWERVDPGVGGEIQGQGGLDSSERKWADAVVVVSGLRGAWASQEFSQSCQVTWRSIIK